MADEVFGLSEQDVSRLKRLLSDYESGKFIGPANAAATRKAPIETYLARANEDIASGTIGTAVIVLINDDASLTPQSTVINVLALSGDIANIAYITVIRDPLSGTYVVASGGGNGAAPIIIHDPSPITIPSPICGQIYYNSPCSPTGGTGSYGDGNFYYYDCSCTSGPVLRRFPSWDFIQNTFRPIVAKITGCSLGAYAWTEQQDNGAGSMGTKSGGLSGTTSANSAYEISGHHVPIGEIVLLWPGNVSGGSTEYLFDHPVKHFSAVITGNSSGVYTVQEEFAPCGSGTVNCQRSVAAKEWNNNANVPIGKHVNVFAFGTPSGSVCYGFWYQDSGGTGPCCTIQPVGQVSKCGSATGWPPCDHVHADYCDDSLFTGDKTVIIGGSFDGINCVLTLITDTWKFKCGRLLAPTILKSGSTLRATGA